VLKLSARGDAQLCEDGDLMTADMNTVPSKSAPTRSAKPAARESAVGLHKHKRPAADIGIALTAPLVGQEFLDKYNLRDPLNQALTVSADKKDDM
jgi:hypothetical protein